MDPLTVSLIAGAVGGGAGKFVERAWDSGEKWINSYFENHQKAAITKAHENSMGFLDELAHRISILEQSQQISKGQLEAAQDHPDFSVLLQKALLSAAQTGTKEKHVILARLVSDRLKADPDNLFSLASKLACDAIGFLNTRQLKILGLQASLSNIRPRLELQHNPSDLTPETYSIFLTDWLEKQLDHFHDVEVANLDLLHLEALSCIKWNPIGSADLAQVLSYSNKVSIAYDLTQLTQRAIGQKVLELWENHQLKSVTLTSVGTIIGIYVSDLLTGVNTLFDGWE